MSTQGFPNPHFPQPPPPGSQYPPPQYPPPPSPYGPPPPLPPDLLNYGMPYYLPPQPPRVWSALVGGVVAIILAFAAAIAALIPSLLTSGVNAQDETALLEWVAVYAATTYVGLLVVLLPGQVAFGGSALAGAWLSPEPGAQRLGLHRLGLPLWTVPVLMLGTPFIGWCVQFVLSGAAKDGPSPHLKMLERIIMSPTGGRAALLFFLVAVMPGVCEELLFRGYVQRRLLRRWHVLPAILLTSVMFAVAHFDPMHMMGVFPIGIWFGIVAWRTDSTWPAVACHFANNGAAILMGWTFGSDFAVPKTPVQAIVVLAMAVAFLASILILFTMARPTPPETPAMPQCPYPSPAPYPGYAYPYAYPAPYPTMPVQLPPPPPPPPPSPASQPPQPPTSPDGTGSA